MEITIILIVLAAVAYLIYKVHPNTKFGEAVSLLNAGRFAEAEAILNALFEKHPEAPAKLAESKLKQGLLALPADKQKAVSFFGQISEIEKRLPANANKSLYETVQAKAALELSKINFEDYRKELTAEARNQKLKQGLESIGVANKKGVESEFENLRLQHLSELANNSYAIGIAFERKENPDDALRGYEFAKNYARLSNNATVLTNAIVRAGICKLKKRENIPAEILSEVDRASAQLKNDFYYRYCKKLLQEKDYAAAENILAQKLNFSSPAIEIIRELLRVKKLKEAIKTVSRINYSIEQLYINNFPIAEVKDLYEAIDKQIDEIKLVLPAAVDKLKQLKPGLFNRLLLHYITENRNGEAFNLIQKQPLFWKDLHLLKNLGICCYGFVKGGSLSDKNYKLIISAWLTAVFCDRIIISSLEETSWDDNYTFTLIDSIGSSYVIDDDLPYNINYEPVSQSNISIGATQQELLKQFKTALNEKIGDSPLAETILDFYQEEKTALEKVVATLTNDMFYPAPHFSKNYGINETVIKTLDRCYVQQSDEEVLRVGIPYLKAGSDSCVSEFAAATNTIADITKAIETGNLTTLKGVITEKQKELIKKYNGPSSAIETTVYNAIERKAEEEEESETLVQMMEAIIPFSPNNDKLKFQYANYVSNYCIAKVNGNKIDNYKALTLMHKAYEYSPGSNRICENFVTLIRFNLMDIINKRTTKSTDIYKILNTVVSKLSKVFIQASSELSKARTDIIRELKAAGVDLSLVLKDETFPKYEPLFFDHLPTKQLTTDGEQLKTVLSLLKKLSEPEATPMTLIDRLLSGRR